MTYARRIVVPVIAVVLGVALAFGVIDGVCAAWSAFGGGLAVVLLLLATPALLGPVTMVMPNLSLAAALTFYVTKVAVLAACLMALSASELRSFVDIPALAVAVIVTTVTWSVLLVVTETRTRRPTYDLP